MLLKSRGDGRYLRVCIWDNNKFRDEYVHRIVAKLFLGDRSEEGLIVCHKNGNKKDNRICNLRWDTYRGNYSDRKLHGTHQNGQRGPNAKLKDAQVVKILKLLGSMPQKLIAEKFRVSQSTIGFISSGKTWRHIDRTKQIIKRIKENQNEVVCSKNSE